MTSSSDAPAALSTVSMLLKVCSVCSARSSLTTLPVFGSKPPWPDRKIHSPTVSPGEYGPGGGGTSALMRVFMDGALLGVGQSVTFGAVYIPIGIRHQNIAPNRRRASPAMTSSMASPVIPRVTHWHGPAQLHPYLVCDVLDGCSSPFASASPSR